MPGATRKVVSLLARLDARAGNSWRAFARRHPVADVVAVNTTDLGSMFMVGGASAVLLAKGRTRLAAELGAAGGAAWFVAQGAKTTFVRPRPFEADLTLQRLIHPPTGTSFPSGHAAVAVAAATLLSRRSRPGRRWVWPLLGAWVPLTRIHVGVHYPADVAAGAAMGWAIGRAVTAASDRLVGPGDAPAAAEAEADTGPDAGLSDSESPV